MNGWQRAIAGGCMALLACVAQAADEFLDPEAAFPLKVQVQPGPRVALRFDVPTGYYLYRDRLGVVLTPPDAQAGELALPHGHVKFDAALGARTETLRDTVVATLPVAGGRPFTLEVRSQGCADKGLCYAPLVRAFRIQPAAGGWEARALAAGDDAPATAQAATPAVEAPVRPEPAAVPVSATPTAEDTGRFARVLGSGSLWRVAGVFLLAGLLLSFTPCVLPMIPILSSIIVGQSGTVSRLRGFSLALAYSLGMALVYTGFGMAAGLAGEGLAGALQNGWVLGGFALLLAALSLSMFGLYELQVPGALQGRVAAVSGTLRGGRHAGVFVMGGLSALIVGPCVAAPLAGALVYISQTRDVAIGGTALFALACGMSVPLLLVGLSAGSLLPRAGAWMERVKHLFGIALLGVALWMVSPVLPPAVLMLLLVAALLGLAAYLGAFERLPEGSGFWRHAGKAAGLMLGLMAALEMVGLASSGRDPLQPLSHLALAGPARAAPAEGLRFSPVAGVQALDQAVSRSTLPVMLDVYADWCVSCKELDAQTFTDPAVRQRLSGMTLLRADVTGNSAEDKALMKRYGLFGPPALLFFAPGRGERVDARVIGYQPAPRFLQTLESLGSAAQSTP